MANPGTSNSDGWEKFLDRWPVTARVAGVVGGFASFGVGLLTGKGPDPAWLAFCSGLLVAPIVFKRGDTPAPPAPAAPDEQA